MAATVRWIHIIGCEVVGFSLDPTFPHFIAWGKELKLNIVFFFLFVPLSAHCVRDYMESLSVPMGLCSSFPVEEKRVLTGDRVKYTQ